MDSKNVSYAYRGIYKGPVHIRVDKSGLIKIQMDGTNWLGDTDTFVSATWKVEDDSTAVTISDTSLATPIATAYVSCTDYGEPVNIKVSCVSDAAVAETCTRSFVIHRVRTA
jgi:hypothetical protein